MNEYLIALARASGLTVTLQGVIGSQHYMSVTGTLEALRRFGDAYKAAPIEATETPGAEKN